MTVLGEVVDFVLDWIFNDDPPIDEAIEVMSLNIRDQKIVVMIVQDILNSNPNVSQQTAIQWAERIVYEAQKYDINPFLIASQANLESSWRPDVVGKASDTGLLQLTPPTAYEIARKLGVKNFHIDMLKNPMTNIEFSAYYLNYCYERTSKFVKGDEASHDWLALASYNRGVIPAVKSYISGKLDSISYVEHVRKRFMENYHGIGVIFDGSG